MPHVATLIILWKINFAIEMNEWCSLYDLVYGLTILTSVEFSARNSNIKKMSIGGMNKWMNVSAPAKYF